MEHLSQPIGGAAQQDLSIAHSLIVFRHREVNLAGQSLHLAEQFSSLVDIASGVLAHAELGHLMHQLGIDKHLLARLRMVGLEFKGVDALLVGDLVVEAVCADWYRGHREADENCRNREPHEEPPLLRIYPRP